MGISNNLALVKTFFFIGLKKAVFALSILFDSLRVYNCISNIYYAIIIISFPLSVVPKK